VRSELVTLAGHLRRMVCASVSHLSDGLRADTGALRWRHRRIGVRLCLLAVFFPAAQSIGSGLFELRKLRLCGGGPAAELTKLDMAAAEGPDVVVPLVLADSSGDDNSDHMDTSRECATQALSSSQRRTPSAPTGQAGSSGPRAWTAEEIRAVQEKVLPTFCHDPHLQIRPLTADGGISKHMVQAGGRGPVTPKDGETVFFHYELYYEDALVASSRVRNGRFQPALSQRLKSRHAGGREQDGGAQAHEAHEAASLSSWEVILRNMSRGERALVFVTTERRQRQLVLAPFMTAAANISSHLLRTASFNTNATSGGAGCPASRDKDMLARKPMRLLVEVLAFGRELLQPPVPWPAAYLGAVPTLRLETEAEAKAESLCGALRGGHGQVVYECRGWGSGDASPDFGDEVLVRWGVVRGKGKWGGGWDIGAPGLANCRSLLCVVRWCMQGKMGRGWG
jgi:hypothetical protein